jgi:hypothetical protein
VGLSIHRNTAQHITSIKLLIRAISQMKKPVNKAPTGHR